MNFIEELYYRNIRPNQKQYNRNSQYVKALKRFYACENKLNELLEDKEAKIFIDLINAHDEITAVGSLENFKLVFRLGVKLIYDSLVFDKDQIFEDITDERTKM